MACAKQGEHGAGPVRNLTPHTRRGETEIIPDVYKRQVLLGSPARRARYDFTYGNLEPGTFPALAWRTITDDVLLSVESAGCDAYNDPFGEEALRVAIAWRIATQRDIDCTPGQVIVQGGTQTSVQNLLALFDGAADTVAMERCV